MPITKLTAPADPFAATADWTRALAYFTQIWRGIWNGPVSQIDFINDNVLKGAVFQIGDAIFYADADTAISGTPSNYVQLTPGASTAAAAYVANLTGVTWSDTYNGYYDGSGNLYVFDELLAYANGEITSIREKVSTNILTFIQNESEFATDLVQKGRGLKISGISNLDVTWLDSSTVAVFDSGTGTLTTYSWSGISWSSVGNPLSVALSYSPSICTLTSTSIAVFGDQWLRTYSWDGTDWSQTGNSLALTNAVNGGICTLDSNTIALCANQVGARYLRSYSWDGTDWTLDGNSLAITFSSYGAARITELTSSSIAVVSAANDNLRTFSFDGTNWTQTGSTLSITMTDNTESITTIDSTNILLCYNDYIVFYYWNGTNWLPNSKKILMTDYGNPPAIAAYDDHKIAFINVTDEVLYTLERPLLLKEGIMSL